MAKQTANPIEVKAVVTFGPCGEVYCVDDVSIHYGLSCEHGNLGRKGLLLERNQEVQNIIKDFIEEGMRQVDINEEIPEMDSVLDYNGAPDNLTIPPPPE